MAACLLRPLPASRRLHCLVIGVALLNGATLLVYRDLHPTGLWLYNNYHYFKWLLPVFGLYTVLLLRMLCQPGRLAAAAATLAVVAGLFMWRVQAVEPMPMPRLLSGKQDVLLPTGLSRLDDALFVAAKTLPTPAISGSTLFAPALPASSTPTISRRIRFPVGSWWFRSARYRPSLARSRSLPVSPWTRGHPGPRPPENCVGAPLLGLGAVPSVSIAP